MKRSLDTEYVRMLCQLVSGQIDPLGLALEMWRPIVDAAGLHHLEPMLWRMLKQAGLELDSALEASLTFAVQHTTIMNMLLEEELRAVETALSQDQIPAIWLKGLVLAHSVYPNAMLRPMGDLDVLVPYDRREDALQSVQAQGYYFEQTSRHLVGPGEALALQTLHHYHLRRDGSIVTLLELHFRLLGRNPELLPMAQLEWFFDQTMNMQIGDWWCRTLTPEAHLLYLCAHAIIQHGEGGIAFVHFLDIHLLITETDLNWDLIIDKAQDLRWSYALERALERIISLFGTDIPDHILGDLRAYRSADDQIEWAEILRQDQEATQWDRIQMMLRGMPLPQRLRMMWRMAFPPASYMRSRYAIGEGKWIAPYYVQRWWSQARQIMLSISQRVRRKLRG